MDPQPDTPAPRPDPPSILWRRLDQPGHDACRLLAERGGGWRLEGTAVLREAGDIARLDYRVTCDSAWRARTGEVRGWWGRAAVDLRIERRGEQWSVDGAVAPGVEGLVDLDLGFTPATNLTLLRRLDLELGQAADVDVAWIDLGRRTLARLPQRYERRSETTYAYAAPSFGYAALLEVGPAGFVVRYPDLWQAE